MLTYSTPNCLANTRSSAVKWPGICREILMPRESGSRGRPPAKTGPAPRAAAPMARMKSRRFKVQLLYLIAAPSFRRFIESTAPRRKRRFSEQQGQYAFDVKSRPSAAPPYSGIATPPAGRGHFQIHRHGGLSRVAKGTPTSVANRLLGGSAINDMILR
jgi:hypothetical protein